jgi:hypothetical protein
LDESLCSFFGCMSRFSVTLTDLSVSPSITWSVFAVCSVSVAFSSSSAVSFSSSPSCNSCCSSSFSASSACVSPVPSEMLFHCYNYIQFISVLKLRCLMYINLLTREIILFWQVSSIILMVVWTYLSVNSMSVAWFSCQIYMLYFTEHSMSVYYNINPWVHGWEK